MVKIHPSGPLMLFPHSQRGIVYVSPSRVEATPGEDTNLPRTSWADNVAQEDFPRFGRHNDSKERPLPGSSKGNLETREGRQTLRTMRTPERPSTSNSGKRKASQNRVGSQDRPAKHSATPDTIPNRQS